MYSVPNRTIYACFLAVCCALPSSQAQQHLRLSPEKLCELDATEKVTCMTPADRLSKVLLPQAPEVLKEKDPSLCPKTLEESVSTLAQSPEFSSLVIKSLRDGDSLLADCLQNALVSLNLPSPTAASVVEKWASTGPDETFSSLSANVESSPDVTAAFVKYYKECDVDWVKLTRGVSQIAKSPSPSAKQSLAVAIANSTGENVSAVNSRIEKASKGDYRELWNLTSDSKKILTSRGALARAIVLNQNYAGSLYEAGWDNLCKKISSEQVLTKEYMRGTERLTPLLDAYKVCLIDSTHSSKKDILITGMLTGATIPSSRFRWMVEELSGMSFQSLGDRMATERDAKKTKDDISSSLEKAVEKNPEWPPALLWHLTRPAEAVALSTRMGLNDAFSQDEAFARDYIKYGSPLGSVADRAIEACGGYSYYPGGRVELVKKCESGEVKKEALLQFNTALAIALSQYDFAWEGALDDGDSNGWSKRIVINTMARVPSSATAWAQTMTKNDSSLRAGFEQWLAENRALPNEEGNVQRWLSSVTSSASSEQSFGNADVARFKKLFGEFLATQSGWKLAKNRLLLEGRLFPGALRAMLERTIITNPDDFWRLFRILTASNGDSMSRLRPFLGDFVSSSRLPKMILDETAAQNAFAADASAPLWTKLLEPDSPAIKELKKTMEEVKVMTAPFSLGNLCVIETVMSEEGWQRASLVAPALLEKVRYSGGKTEGENDREKLVYALTNHAPSCAWVYSTLLADKDFRAAWAARVLSKVLYMGKAPAVSWLFIKNDELFNLWKNELGVQVTRDPYLLRAFIDSLVTRRIGDFSWQEQVDSIRIAVSSAVFGDRILVEQMLGYPGMEYRKGLNSSVNEIFGGYVVDKWQE